MGKVGDGDHRGVDPIGAQAQIIGEQLAVGISQLAIGGQIGEQAACRRVETRHAPRRRRQRDQDMGRVDRRATLRLQSLDSHRVEAQRGRA